MVDAGVERNISLKLTQLGLDVDRATAIDNLRRILDVAGRDDFFVRIDMENSPYTDATLDIFETVWSARQRQRRRRAAVGAARSEDDLRRVNRLGARVRLVKGAYKEPRSIAYRLEDRRRRRLRPLMRVLLPDGTYPAIATHDPAMIDATRDWARSGTDWPRTGSSSRCSTASAATCRQSLVDDGYRVRVYIPFGREWFPYFMRRLGERPANVGFVVRSLIRERRHPSPR